MKPLNDPLESLSSDLNRAYPGSEPEVPLSLLTDLANDISTPRVTPIRRRAVGVAATVLAAALLIPGGVAAATMAWQALTGEYGVFDDSDAPVKHEEPAINPCAADYPAFAASLPAPDTDAPPSTTWGDLARTAAERSQEFARQDCASHGVRMGVTGVRAETMQQGLYLWQCLTITRAAHGDAVGARQAGAHTASLYEELHELGIWGGDFWIPLRDAARAVDVGVLKQDSLINSPVPCP